MTNMERVLDVYKRPFNKDFPVVYMDESPKQLIKETPVGNCNETGAGGQRILKMNVAG